MCNLFASQLRGGYDKYYWRGAELDGAEKMNAGLMCCTYNGKVFFYRKLASLFFLFLRAETKSSRCVGRRWDGRGPTGMIEFAGESSLSAVGSTGWNPGGILRMGTHWQDLSQGKLDFILAKSTHRSHRTWLLDITLGEVCIRCVLVLMSEAESGFDCKK